METERITKKKRRYSLESAKLVQEDYGTAVAEHPVAIQITKRTVAFSVARALITPLHSTRPPRRWLALSLSGCPRTRRHTADTHAHTAHAMQLLTYAHAHARCRATFRTMRTRNRAHC